MRKIFSGLPVFFLICVGLLIFLETSISPDYCRNENRTLSDQELIEIAITDELRRGSLKLSTDEETANDFYKNHPTCCEVTRASKKSLYSRVFGSDDHTIDSDISVKMIYETNETNLNGKKINFHRFIEESLAMNACGVIANKLTIGRQSLLVE